VASTIPASAERQFNRGSWLILFIAIVFLAFGIADTIYRFTLPTDGWEVTEGSLPGYSYIKNLAGNSSRLRPGDRVTAVEGIPADWQTITHTPMLQESWRVGARLEYRVNRGGQEIRVPVTLVKWQFWKWLRATLRDPGKVAGLISGYFLLVLAAFTFLRRPGNPAAGAFLIIIEILASGTLGGALPSGFSVWIDPVANFLGDVAWFLLLALFPFALIRFALVFPHPKPIQQRHPELSYGALAIGLALAIFAPDSPIRWFWFVFSLFLTVAILIHNAITMRDAVSRAQMRWGLGGVVLGFGTLALMFLAGTLGLFEVITDISALMFAIATTLMGVMLTVAITRYRLFDIDVIIRRTLVYTVVSGLLILTYFGSVVILQLLFAAVTGESSPVAIVISTLLIAALFGTVRRRVQAAIDRRFFRQKYDAAQALAAFSQTARDEVDLDQLTARLLLVVDETMRPAHLTLWLKDAEGKERR